MGGGKYWMLAYKDFHTLIASGDLAPIPLKGFILVFVCSAHKLYCMVDTMDATGGHEIQ